MSRQREDGGLYRLGDGDPTWELLVAWIRADEIRGHVAQVGGGRLAPVLAPIAHWLVALSPGPVGIGGPGPLRGLVDLHLAGDREWVDPAPGPVADGGVEAHDLRDQGAREPRSQAAQGPGRVPDPEDQGGRAQLQQRCGIGDPGGGEALADVRFREGGAVLLAVPELAVPEDGVRDPVRGVQGRDPADLRELLREVAHDQWELDLALLVGQTERLLQPVGL